jgi:hypothetical protein
MLQPLTTQAPLASLQKLREYLKSMDGGWVNWDNTVDTFKSGNPEAEHLKARFPNISVHFIPQSCMFQLVYSPTKGGDAND